MPMRVYELARKLGMENRDLIPELKKMGAAVSSHSSALEEEVVQKALEKLGSKAKGAVKTPDGEVGHAARHQDGGHATKPANVKTHPAEEQAKPDKRRILIKRKKEDEPVEAVAPAGDADVAPAPMSVGHYAPPASPVHHAGAEAVPAHPSESAPHHEPSPLGSLPSAPSASPH